MVGWRDMQEQDDISLPFGSLGHVDSLKKLELQADFADNDPKKVSFKLIQRLFLENGPSKIKIMFPTLMKL